MLQGIRIIFKKIYDALEYFNSSSAVMVESDLVTQGFQILTPPYRYASRKMSSVPVPVPEEYYLDDFS